VIEALTQAKKPIVTTYPTRLDSIATQHTSGGILPLNQLLTLAVDWIEAEATNEQPTVATRLHHQIAKCELACRSVCHAAHTEQTIEILGLAGDYPLTLGLALLSAESGKPWGFIMHPHLWTREEWQRVTDALARLKDKPILYRTGFKKVSLMTRTAT
jgi:hypothetical protein